MKNSKGTKEGAIFSNNRNKINIKSNPLAFHKFKTYKETPIKIFPHVDFPFSAFFTSPNDDDNFIMILILSFLSYKDYLRLQSISKNFIQF